MYTKYTYIFALWNIFSLMYKIFKICKLHEIPYLKVLYGSGELLSKISVIASSYVYVSIWNIFYYIRKCI